MLVGKLHAAWASDQIGFSRRSLCSLRVDVAHARIGVGCTEARHQGVLGGRVDDAGTARSAVRASERHGGRRKGRGDPRKLAGRAQRTCSLHQQSVHGDRNGVQSVRVYDTRIVARDLPAAEP